MPETVLVRCAGGGVQAMDLPPAGTLRREMFDQKFASGHWQILDEQPPAPIEAPASAGPDGTIDEVVAWVRQDDEDGEPTDGWPSRAAEALASEQSKAEPRKSLVRLLSGLVES